MAHPIRNVWVRNHVFYLLVIGIKVYQYSYLYSFGVYQGIVLPPI